MNLAGNGEVMCKEAMLRVSKRLSLWHDFVAELCNMSRHLAHRGETSTNYAARGLSLTDKDDVRF